MAILTELRDPRIRNVTVTYVEVSPDMRHAKIHVSVMGDDSQQKLTLRGLENAAGFLQQKVAKRIDTRYTPRIAFALDHGVKHSIEVSRLLSELLPPPPAAEPEAGDETESDDAGSDDAEAAAAPEADEKLATDPSQNHLEPEK
jgi:ribosome-binding factor A